MTVNYNLEVSTSGFGTFLRLMFRWKGSVYKCLYKELLIFLLLYFTLSLTYRFAMNPAQRETFEAVSLYCDKYSLAVPITFILGFYMSIVFTRWNQIFDAIAWPDNVGLYVGTYVGGADEEGRRIRRTVMRWLALSQVLVLRNLSTNVRKRFPSLHHLLQRLITYRQTLHSLECLDWISIPLVYSQVVTLATWFFFLTCIIGRQFLDPDKGYTGHDFDGYFPLFTLVQLLIFAGWLKAAETLLNPMGEDDDDFELNYIIDRNLQVGYELVDGNFMRVPPMERDLFWDDPIATLPHTRASKGCGDTPMEHSCAELEISDDEAELLPTEAELRRAQVRNRVRAVPKMLTAVRVIQSQQRAAKNAVERSKDPIDPLVAVLSRDHGHKQNKAQDEGDASEIETDNGGEGDDGD